MPNNRVPTDDELVEYFDTLGPEEVCGNISAHYRMCDKVILRLKQLRAEKDLAAALACEECAKLASEHSETIPYQVDCSNGTVKGAVTFSGEKLAEQFRSPAIAESVKQTMEQAEMYRYARSNHSVDAGEPFICRQVRGNFSRWTEQSADAAIRSAMKGGADERD